MSRIKIKNFGPIHEGFTENDGWMDVRKVTVFTGSQGTGKSTVAKLISIFSWLEKSIVRNDISISKLNTEIFKNLCVKQELIEYFHNGETHINYEGDACCFEYDDGKGIFYGRIIDNSDDYVMPKVQYISAARNLLTILYSISQQKITDKKGNVIDLASNIPFMVRDLNNEYLMALAELAKDGFSLPLERTQVYFQNHSTFIKTEDTSISMCAASSGIQSITPLLIVSSHLSKQIQKDLSEKIETADSNLINWIESELGKEDKPLAEKFKLFCSFGKTILDDEGSTLSLLEKKLRKYIPSSFTNIVEEPEQNLFPTSQQSVLYSLMNFNNAITNNKLILTTHSPYIISYLTLAIKANELFEKARTQQQVRVKISEIVPELSTVAAQNVVIYELYPTGEIKQLEVLNGLPSDDNYLNNELEATNILFDKLLELEDLCQ